MPIKDKVGQRFGRLTVVSLSHTGDRGVAHWRCSCDCGRETVVATSNLGRSVNSCGCIRKELNSTYYVTHGMSGTVTHRIWKGIVSRCTIPTATGYDRYGAAGITVCERWKNSFENFLADMGEQPSKSHSVDRINNDLGYSPENCRWATRIEQNRNTRTNRFITANGETRCLSEWASILEISEATIRDRLDRGWSDSDAVTVPKDTVERGFFTGARKITVDNETHTVGGWAAKLNVRPHAIRNKVAYGRTFEEAVREIMNS